MGPPGAPRRLGPADDDRHRRPRSRRPAPTRRCAWWRCAVRESTSPRGTTSMPRSRRTRRRGGDHRGLPANDARVLAAPGAGCGGGGRVCVAARSSSRRAATSGSAATACACDPGGWDRAGGEQRRHAPAAGGARQTAARKLLLSGELRGAHWARRRLRKPRRGPEELDARTPHWTDTFSRSFARRRGGHEGDAQRSASATCCPPRWTARRTTACASSTSRTPCRAGGVRLR